MYHRFITHISEHKLIPQATTTLLAVSGGVDSIVLLNLFGKAKMPFAIAHANFGLRPEANQVEAKFIQSLATKYEVPYHTKLFHTIDYAKANKLSIQVAARQLRYDWFSQLIARQKYHQLATAHHHSDQLETFLLNIAKGSGIEGLQGIPRQRDQIIRPLLFATKKEIVTYAERENLRWCEDTSNQSTKYQRNWIRHKVIPTLQELNPALEKTFYTTLKKMEQLSQLLKEQAITYRKLVWQADPPYHHINPLPLQGKPWAPTLLTHWLAPYGFTFKVLEKWWHDNPPPGKKIDTPTHWLLADRNQWILGPQVSLKPSNPQPITKLPTQLAIPQGRLHIGGPQAYHHNKAPLDNPPHIALLDYDKVTLPLIVRPWQAGDSFCPLGMKNRHKKLSDLCIDKKIPQHKKKSVYLLTSAGKIIWVIGQQIDNRFKVTPQTRSVIKCTLASESIIPHHDEENK